MKNLAFFGILLERKWAENVGEHKVNDLYSDWTNVSETVKRLRNTVKGTNTNLMQCLSIIICFLLVNINFLISLPAQRLDQNVFEISTGFFLDF